MSDIKLFQLNNGKATELQGDASATYAKQLDIEVAERQAEFLRSCGCTLGQGYLYARPGPAVEVEKWLRKNARRVSGRAAGCRR